MPKWFEEYLRTLSSEQANELLVWFDEENEYAAEEVVEILDRELED